MVPGRCRRRCYRPGSPPISTRSPSRCGGPPVGGPQCSPPAMPSRHARGGGRGPLMTGPVRTIRRNWSRWVLQGESRSLSDTTEYPRRPSWPTMVLVAQSSLEHRRPLRRLVAVLRIPRRVPDSPTHHEPDRAGARHHATASTYYPRPRTRALRGIAVAFKLIQSALHRSRAGHGISPPRPRPLRVKALSPNETTNSQRANSSPHATPIHEY